MSLTLTVLRMLRTEMQMQKQLCITINITYWIKVHYQIFFVIHLWTSLMLKMKCLHFVKRVHKLFCGWRADYITMISDDLCLHNMRKQLADISRHREACFWWGFGLDGSAVLCKCIRGYLMLLKFFHAISAQLIPQRSVSISSSTQSHIHTFTLSQLNTHQFC